MAVPKRKVSKSRLGHRKNSHRVHVRKGTACPQCGGLRLSHRACPACGNYNGRQVLTIESA